MARRVAASGRRAPSITMGGMMAAMPSRIDPLHLAIADAIEAYRAPGAVPGISVAVTDRDRTVGSAVAGHVDVAAGRPVEPGTLFEIGSIGKAFTALVVLALAAEGRLALDDPVVRHLPWFRVPRTGDRITIHHLLSHTAGISAGIDGTPEAMFQVWRLRDLPPGSAPGRRFHYSNAGYKALGLVIEALEGEPYSAVIGRRLLGPLGMADSAAAITESLRTRMAIGYVPAYSERRWERDGPLAPATWLSTGTADGSVAATAGDMGGFLRHLMADPSGHVALMAQPVEAIGAWGYGYGLFGRDVDGRRYLGHGGGMVGYQSGMQWDPEQGIGAVVLQSCYGGNPNALARQVVRMAVAVRDGRDPSTEAMESDAAGEEGDAGPAGVPVATPPTAEGAALVGTYRSHDPWEPVLRVEARGDRLWLVFPAGGGDGFEDGQALVPMARGWYRVGEDRLGPERMRFDTIIGGLARRAWLSGWPYFRTDPEP